MSDDCSHDWRHVETTDCSRYMDGLLKVYECTICGVEQEEVYTLQKRVIDGEEVNI